jgi:hypothetical protein
MDTTPNVGKADRIIRYIIGFSILSLVGFLDGMAKLWGLLGLIPVFTALIEFCPVLYKLGINTRGHSPTTHHPAH